MEQLNLGAALPAIGNVFIMGVIGYAAVRRRLLTTSGVAELTRVLVDFILPCTLFHAMFTQFAPERLPYVARAGAVQVALFFAAVALAWAGHRLLRLRSHRGTLMALSGLQNNVYLPLPLVLAMLNKADGERAQFYIGCFVMFFNPLLWTVGVALMAGGGEVARHPLAVLKRMATPPLLACVAGVLVKSAMLALGWTMPAFVLTVTRTVGDATVPLAMIVLGALLANAHWGRDFEPRAVALVGVVKLVLIPLAALAWLRWRGGWDPIFNLVVLVEAAAPPATNTTLAVSRYGGNTSLVALVLFVTYLASLLTMPLWLRML